MTLRTITRNNSASRRAPKGTSLRKTDIERFRQLLQVQRDDITEDLRILKESLRSLQDHQQGIGAWNLDFARDSADTESAENIAVQIRRLSDTLNQIAGALRRIENGTFGICVRCGKIIDIERLEAVPFTRRCIACKSNIRAGEDQGG
ncbi:MAG: RNA polymerase-binding protein DksA [Bacteroidia bacterium]|nr:MAG: RNA polymerase-binding protein DksA [Bacteroidia bacterium]